MKSTRAPAQSAYQVALIYTFALDENRSLLLGEQLVVNSGFHHNRIIAKLRRR